MMKDVTKEDIEPAQAAGTAAIAEPPATLCEEQLAAVQGGSGATRSHAGGRFAFGIDGSFAGFVKG